MNTATLRLACPDAAAAARLAAALAPDDPGHLRLQVDGAVVVCGARADSVLGLLRTLEDVFDCARATGLVA